MKTTLKKIAAVLTALLMLVQIVPALANVYSSGILAGGDQGYRELLEIVASKGTFVLIGQTLELDVNEGYDNVKWTSEDETIATIDEKGIVTALTAGTVKITAEDGEYSADTEVTVIDPAPLMADAEKDQEPEQDPENEPEGEPEGEPEKETPVQKQYAIIVINGENSRYVYDGEEHTLNTFIATSNQSFFDASKVRVNGEIGVSAVNCGTYEFKLKESDFSYNDKNVVATFVVNNGWMKITPAKVTVTANPATKQAGEADPELTATVDGVFGDDTVKYELERYPGEEVGEYIIDVEGKAKQGNYKVQFIPSVLTITEAAAKQEPLEVWVTSTHPADEPVEYGMGITLVAKVSGAEEGEYTIQWQYSTDMYNWTDVPGANSLTYTFTANGETVTYAWRAVVDRIQ